MKNVIDLNMKVHSSRKRKIKEKKKIRHGRQKKKYSRVATVRKRASKKRQLNWQLQG